MRSVRWKRDASHRSWVGVVALAAISFVSSWKPAGCDIYDEVALLDLPWAYWRLVPPPSTVGANASGVVADSSKRSTSHDRDGGRFPGVFENGYNTGVTTVELFFSPACNTSAASASQSLIRLMTEATAFAPRILLERGAITAYMALNDVSSNSSYFAELRKLQVPGPTPMLHGGGGVWEAGGWHHVVLVFNGTCTSLYINGTRSAEWFEAEPKLFGDSCVRKAVEKCERGSGVALGEGFNGKMQRVAVYDHALPQSRIAAHYQAFFDNAVGEGRAHPRHRSRGSRVGSVQASSEMLASGGGGKGEGVVGGEGSVELGGRGTDVGEGSGARTEEVAESRTGVAFMSCRLPFEERDAGMGPGLIPPVMSFLVMAIGLTALLTAVILHLIWTNLAHGGGGDLGAMCTRIAIPEHSVVLDDPPQYPLNVLGTLGMLLPIAYLSQWYNELDATTRDGREAFMLHYVLWLACESGGTLLLLALTNLHDPQGACALGLLLISALTVVLGAIADLQGGVEGATVSSLCPRHVQGPPPLDLGAGGWGDFWNGGGGGLWGWGCLPPVGWYCPVTAVAMLSMAPVYILTSLPVCRRGRHTGRNRPGVERQGWRGSARDAPEEAVDDDDTVVPLLRRAVRGAPVDRWGCVGYLLQLGRAGVMIVCGDEDVQEWDNAEDSSMRERASRSKTLLLMRLWFFGSMVLRRIGWVLVVGLRGSHLTDDQRLILMGSVDSLSVASLAAIIWSGEATDWPSAIQRRRARAGLPPPASNPSDSEHDFGQDSPQDHMSEDSEINPQSQGGPGARGDSVFGTDSVFTENPGSGVEGVVNEWGCAVLSMASSISSGFARARASDVDGEDPFPQSSDSEHSEITPHAGASDGSGVTPWTAWNGSSVGGWSDNVLFRELRELGYMVWRDPLRHTMQAASGEDFQLSQCLGLLVSLSTLLALAAFLVVKSATPVLDIDCWTSAALLFGSLNSSAPYAAGVGLPLSKTMGSSAHMTMDSWRMQVRAGRGVSFDQFVGENARLPLLQCRMSCAARENLLPPVFGTDATTASLEGNHVVWGWNDVYGGGREATKGKSPLSQGYRAKDGGETESLYADKSAMCRSAVHAGLLPAELGTEDGAAEEEGGGDGKESWWLWEWLNYVSASLDASGGCFSIEVLRGQAIYKGDMRNGVESLSLNFSDRPLPQASFSYRVVPPSMPCPSDLANYALLCILPLCGALVAACLAPPLLWISLLCVTFWLRVLFDTRPVPGSGGQLLGKELFGGTDGSAWWGRGGESLQDFAFTTLLLVMVSPVFYLVGPAWVLRSPPWLWHIPFPASQKHWQPRLPVPARNPRELVTRNYLCFALPMLVGSSLPPLLPFLRVLCLTASVPLLRGEHGERVDRGMEEEAMWAGSAGWGDAGVWGGGGSLPERMSSVQSCLVTGLVLVLLAVCVRQCKRCGELGRLALVYSVATGAMFVIWLAVREHYKFVVRGYLLFCILVPLTAQDSHAAAVLQGLLLGMVVRDLALHGPLPVWEYKSTSNF